MKKVNKATLLLILSLLVLALTLVATFSWFPRVNGYDTTAYGNLQLDKTARIKYNGLSVETKQTIMVDGKLSVSEQQNVGTAVTVRAHSAVYFRTIVDNKREGTINVTIDGLKLSGNVGTISVCLLSPMKTSNTYTADEYAAGVTLADHIEVVQSTPTVVEWYLYNSGIDDATVNVDGLPLISYNN